MSEELNLQRTYNWHQHPKARWDYVARNLKINITSNIYTYDNVLDFTSSNLSAAPDAHTFSLLVVKAIEPLSVMPQFVANPDNLPPDYLSQLEAKARYYSVSTRVPARLRVLLYYAIAYGDGYGMATRDGIEFYRYDQVEWCGISWEEATAIRIKRYLGEWQKDEFKEELVFEPTTHVAEFYEVWDNDQRVYFYTDTNGSPLTRRITLDGEYNLVYQDYWKGLLRAPIERVSFGYNTEERYDYGLIYPWLSVNDEIQFLRQLHNVKSIQQVFNPKLVPKQIANAVQNEPITEINGMFYVPINTNILDKINEKIASLPIDPLSNEFYTYLQEREKAKSAISHMSDLEMAQPLGGRKTATEIAAIQTATGTWMAQQQNMVIEFLSNLWRTWAEMQLSTLTPPILPSDAMIVTMITGIDMQSDSGKAMKASQLLDITFNSPVGEALQKDKVARRITELLGISDMYIKPEDKLAAVMKAINDLSPEQQQEFMQIVMQMLQQAQALAAQKMGQEPAGAMPVEQMQPQPSDSGVPVATPMA